MSIFVAIRKRLTAKITRNRLEVFLQPHADERRTLEVGAKYKPYRHLFPQTISGDIAYFPELDVRFDAHHLPFAASSFRVILCTEVLEHTHTPQQVLDEFHRVLTPGGKLILTTRFIFPLHDTPHDYFRFTKYGLQHLCRHFSEVTVVEEVGSVETMAVLLQRLVFQVRWKLPGMRLMLALLAKVLVRGQFLVAEEYGSIKRDTPEQHIMASGYYLVAVK
ncbi:MAG: class I SAM-dependent methyltransferase [Chloroflexi bacterium]|nr:MAG: class I SAM-dependent methyltransferase [Chloroflexota bacterium]